MEEEQEVVRAWYCQLISTMDVENLLSRLYQLHIISAYDKEKIRAADTRQERAERLLDLIVTSDNPDWFAHFVDTLDNRYPFLASDLRKAVRGPEARPPQQTMSKVHSVSESYTSHRTPSAHSGSDPQAGNGEGNDSTNAHNQYNTDNFRCSKSVGGSWSVTEVVKGADKLSLQEIKFLMESLRQTLVRQRWKMWQMETTITKAFKPTKAAGIVKHPSSQVTG